MNPGSASARSRARVTAGWPRRASEHLTRSSFLKLALFNVCKLASLCSFQLPEPRCSRGSREEERRRLHHRQRLEDWCWQHLPPRSCSQNQPKNRAGEAARCLRRSRRLPPATWGNGTASGHGAQPGHRAEELEIYPARLFWSRRAGVSQARGIWMVKKKKSRCTKEKFS